MDQNSSLAALLASRLCHDVVGPVGAIQNGLELMAEDESMTEMALDLIRKSAAQATNRLQFARLAYGVAGGAAVLDPAEAGRLTAKLFEGERGSLDWQWNGPEAPREKVKLAMLLASYAQGAVPRGGTVTVRAEDHVTVVAVSDQMRDPPHLDVLTRGADPADPRAVPALMIREVGASLGGVSVTGGPQDLTFAFSL